MEHWRWMCGIACLVAIGCFDGSGNGSGGEAGDGQGMIADGSSGRSGDGDGDGDGDTLIGPGDGDGDGSCPGVAGSCMVLEADCCRPETSTAPVCKGGEWTCPEGLQLADRCVPCDDGGSSGSGAECDTNADCDGGECIELATGGVRVCRTEPTQAVACQADEGTVDECCDSTECSEGKCFDSKLRPFCSGALDLPYNVCAADTCDSDADCSASPGGWCMPAGVLGFRVAMCVGGCRQDSDCNDAADGRCVLEPTTTCCGDVLPRCRYPDTPPVGDECPP